MKNKKLAIIHFQPIELYPPILNLLDLLNIQDSFRTIVYATKGKLVKNQEYYSLNNIVIKRYGWSGKLISVHKRYFGYFSFNIATLIQLILKKPAIVFYYETFSAWPAIMYKKYFNKKVQLFIHYHEYMSSQNYSSGMKLLKAFHKLELKNYSKANWISHTNKFRLHFFKEDAEEVNESVLQILPNFPPSEWHKPPKHNYNNPIRFVIVGSLGLEFLYLDEVLNWIEAGEGKYSIDLYGNINEELRHYFTNKKFMYCFCKGSVAYQDLKDILPNYDIGLILYKSKELNTVYCAPNKLFEYLICGLDVWFSDDLIGCYEYMTSDNPSVKKVNFRDMENFKFSFSDKKFLNGKESKSFYTSVIGYQKLIKELNAL